jgi:hypothetical protein
MRTAFTCLCAVLLLATAAAPPAAFAQEPDTWDGLVKTPSQRMRAVYLAPGADFRGFGKLMIDTPEVAFEKNYLRDYNRTTMVLELRLKGSDLTRAATHARTAFEAALRKAAVAAGYEIVTEPAADVLRLRTGIIDIHVTAPDTRRAGASAGGAVDEAGFATFVIEVRDSATGAILGRAVDRREAGDGAALVRNRLTNRSDFGQLFDRWADASIDGLAALKSRSPSASP